MEIAVLDPYAEQKESAIFKLLLGWKTSGKRVLGNDAAVAGLIVGRETTSYSMRGLNC